MARLLCRIWGSEDTRSIKKKTKMRKDCTDFFKDEAGNTVTVNSVGCRNMLNYFFFDGTNDLNLNGTWFQ